MANRNPSPVAIPDEVRTGLNPQATPILPGMDDGGKYFARIENTFSGLADEIGKVADIAAHEEGKVAGFEAGMDPEFRPKHGFSIRDRSFDASGIATFELNMKTAIAQRAEEIASKYPNDPAAVQREFGKLRDEWSGTFPEAKPIAMSHIEAYRLGSVRSATRKLEGEATAARKDALKENLSARFSALDRAIYGLGLDEKADATVATQLEDLRRDLTAAAGRGDISKSAARDTLQAAEATVASSRILGAFDRLPSFNARQQFADDFARKYSQSEGDFQKLTPDTAQKLQTAMQSRLRSESTGLSAAAKAVAGELSSINKAAEQGLVPPEPTMAGLRAQVAAIDDPALKQAAAITEHTLSLAEAGRKMKVPELEATIEAMNKTMTEKGASSGAIALRDSAVKLLKNMREQLGNDQLGWADRVGLVAVPPLDFSKPDLPLQMRKRAELAETVAGYYGTDPIYLRPAEHDQLERITSAGGAGMIAAAKAINDGFGVRAPKVINELGKNAPVLAHVGALLSTPGSETFANDVAEGLELKRQESLPAAKRTIELPNWIKTAPDKMLAAQRAEIENIYGGAFALSPESGLAAQEAARQAFNARAVRNALDPTLATKEATRTFDRQLQLAAGARFSPDGTQYGGVASYKPGYWSSYKVLVPPDVKADSFRDVVSAVRDEDLKDAVSPSGQPYRARDIQLAVPVAVRGGYRFALGDPASDDPKWIRGKDGKPFVLDLDTLPLRQRVPGAFLGGR